MTGRDERAVPGAADRGLLAVVVTTRVASFGAVQEQAPAQLAESVESSSGGASSDAPLMADAFLDLPGEPSRRRDRTMWHVLVDRMHSEKPERATRRLSA